MEIMQNSLDHLTNRNRNVQIMDFTNLVTPLRQHSMPTIRGGGK